MNLTFYVYPNEYIPRGQVHVSVAYADYETADRFFSMMTDLMDLARTAEEYVEEHLEICKCDLCEALRKMKKQYPRNGSQGIRTENA